MSLPVGFDHAHGSGSAVNDDPSASAMDTSDMLGALTLGDGSENFSDAYLSERQQISDRFTQYTEKEQLDLMKVLVFKMCHYQHGVLDSILQPILKRDFIKLLPPNIAECVLQYLDYKSLCACEQVSHQWRKIIAQGKLWRKLIERKVIVDPLWKGLGPKRGWDRYLFVNNDTALRLIDEALTANASLRQRFEASKIPTEYLHIPNEWHLHKWYRSLYPDIEKDIEKIEDNWRNGRHRLERINCQSENSKGVYCLQYDDNKIVSGLRDNTIKIWGSANRERIQTLTGHSGSVLCLQYDEHVIASGSSDATVRIWDVETGEQLNTLIHHGEAVLHLRFQNGMMVTCSKDRTIAVWDMVSPQEINLRRTLVGHRAAVNVVDFDQRYIVSASGDRTIKVWNASNCEFVRTLNGHRRGIACLQYRDGLIVSGSSDNTIRLWDIHYGNCLRVLEGHDELVRCIRFDSKRIVSGAYDGKIKIWDLKAALDPRSTQAAICLKTLVEHTGRVFRLQFDEFQIVSSSHDDTILIWDFLNADESAPLPSGHPPRPPPPANAIAAVGDAQGDPAAAGNDNDDDEDDDQDPDPQQAVQIDD
ncbi:hypothetical protein QR680_015935 [Steinernema hermaphroditum]|uniref:F-box domain-containing protein n=1 Tax=Steinernema hermaphroditum TaxID=289476 RepID=A0AA39H9R4_9BILA|nr:hypothetical protein QR680_015935 [Steinernema hermaphroditum]